MKKVLISILMLCCVFFASCSVNVDEETRDIAGMPTATSVGEIRIYAYDGNSRGLPLIPNMGHSFISIKNTTLTETFIIAGFEIAPGEEASIGTYGQEAYWGIWFNLETYYLKNNLYPGNVSIAREIASLEDVAALNDYAEANNYWSFTFNCSTFAYRMWNTIAGEDSVNNNSLASTPAEMRDFIKSFRGYEKNRNVESDRNPCFIKEGQLIEVTAKV